VGYFSAPVAALCEKPKNVLNLLNEKNAQLHGKVLDFTCNHGEDRRFWSPTLGKKRDMYVYVPPGFDAKKQYPLILFLHGFTQDEQIVLEREIELFDRAMVSGCLPKCIVAWPDGTPCGEPSLKNSATFFANTKAGRFEDYIVQDVYPFLLLNFPILPQREAHVLAGTSMGGGASFTIAFKHPEMFKIIVGVMPTVNLRYLDKRGRALGNFNPTNWNWRTIYRPNEVVGRFYGWMKIRAKVLSDPMFGRGQQVIEETKRINPIELLETYNVQEGLFDMYIAYGGRDEFNVDAMVESFLEVAHQRGLTIGVGYDPKGRHDLETGTRLFPGAVEWLRPKLEPCLVPLEPLAR
jgi:pimeloyl-ACP methyl ester carboxylesterase